MKDTIDRKIHKKKRYTGRAEGKREIGLSDGCACQCQRFQGDFKACDVKVELSRGAMQTAFSVESRTGLESFA